MKTAIMMVESAVALAHRLANVPNVPVLVELMILVTVSPIVSTILISVMGSILGFLIARLARSDPRNNFVVVVVVVSHFVCHSLKFLSISSSFSVFCHILDLDKFRHV